MKTRWLICWGCVFLFVFVAICLPNNATLFASGAALPQKDYKTDNLKGTVKDPQSSVVSGATLAAAKCTCGCAGTARPACAHSCGGNPCTGASMKYSQIIIGDVVEGKPATFSAIASNGLALTGFVVDLDDGQHVTTDSNGQATFTPKAHLKLGASIADVCATSVRVLTPDEADKLPLSVPRFVTAGTRCPLTVPGMFDGDATNTHVSIGDTQCPVLAESPRQAILRIPPETPLGASQLHIEDHGQKLDQPVSVIRFSMRAEKTTLRKGESTKGAALVDGASPVLVGGVIHLTNLSPETIQLQAGGGSENITKRIESNMIKNGRIEIPMTIHATQGGGFLIVGGVSDPNAKTTAKCSCGCGGTPRPACAHSCGGTPCTGS
jgi:hypothetical protein